MKLMKRGLIDTTDTSISTGMRYFGLGMVGAAALLAYYMFFSVSASQAMSTLISAARSGYTYGVGYSGNMVPALIKSKQVAKVFKVEGDKIYNNDGGEVTVVGNGFGFIATTNDVSESTCTKMSPQLSLNDIKSLSINGKSFTSTISETDSAASCNAGRTNTIVVTTNS
ncbi:hypothetical protein F164LOC_18270 [Pectobacterium carotovorum]|uniref:type 4 pilus major pilin n=1 Tax=Pectobacterium versatile TaxID=2488639 RepID=UPI000C7EBA39|nr:type 4 pilus major pilin [Pectobacterium versatile]PLY35841.1 hypothetical protein F164LOC_18270 [Pectobacterium carotovorum]